MTNERIIQIDSVDAYNKLYGWETLHPLVTVVRSALPLRLSKNHAEPFYSNWGILFKQCNVRRCLTSSGFNDVRTKHLVGSSGNRSK